MRARVPTPRESRPSKIEEAKHIPRPYKLRRFYTPKEVAVHNTKGDVWVSFFDKVFDLTLLISKNYMSPDCDPIVLSGGTDITNWFDPATEYPKTHIDPKTGTKQYMCPQGRFLHVPPTEPNSDWDPDSFSVPWWADDARFCIGKLTTRTRNIRIVNTLTKHDDKIEVASEESLNEILDRYLDTNAHAASYTWKRIGKVLDMSLNLESNGIPDERDELVELGIQDDDYIPAIHLYFNDDLTIA